MSTFSWQRVVFIYGFDHYDLFFSAPADECDEISHEIKIRVIKSCFIKAIHRVFLGFTCKINQAGTFRENSTAFKSLPCYL